MINYSSGTTPVPQLRRWMLFVDGENLTIRGQKLATDKGCALTPGPYYAQDVFLWLPNTGARQWVASSSPGVLEPQAIRGYYYTSVAGDPSKIGPPRDALWALGFAPRVFRKAKQEDKAKGVDITLAKDLLGHAFNGNFDAAVLVAGDGDYVPLVEEVKRLGKLVYVQFFASNGLSPELRLTSDAFFDLEPSFVGNWTAYKP